MQMVTSERVGMLARFFSNANPAAEESRTGSGESPEKTPVSGPGVIVMGENGPLARLVAAGLMAENMPVHVAHTLDTVLSHLEMSANDTLILDLDLADMDGLKVLTDLRAARPGLRIMAVSSRPGTDSLVAALDHGADDYLPKPFSLLEMRARVRALQRRSNAGHCPAEPRREGVVLDKERCQVQRDGRVIDLTPREFTLLEYLMKHPGKTLSRALLTQEVWNMSAETNTNIVDVYIKYLRDKIDGDHSVKLIRTVRGMGYLFQAHA